MDVTSSNKEVVPEKIENKKDVGRQFLCDLNDTELVHKIAQEFLPGLASACVDNTTGDIFRTPGSVAVDIRTEMVEYLTQRSQSFVAESVMLEDDPEKEVSDHPHDIISDFVDDFASTKRNLFSRVSGWLLSEKREDKIDDFVQEMELSGFWLMDRREGITRTLLRNVDFKNEFHCNMKFNSREELHDHFLHCGFRSMNCENEGCSTRFSARQKEKHDSVCPFKMIPCEQNCSAILMRRDMDRHCITVCPMKIANCPFYAVGCQSSIPQCMMEQHRVDDLHSHLLYILQGFHSEASVDDLKKRVKQLEELSSGNLGEARDVRSLTMAVKNLEVQLGSLEASVVKKVTEEGKVGEVAVAGTETSNPETHEAENKVNEEGQASKEDLVSVKMTKAAMGENIEEEKTNAVGSEIPNSTTLGAVNKIIEDGKYNEGGNSNEAGSKTLNSASQETATHEEGKLIEASKKVVATAVVNKISDQGKDNEEGIAKEASSMTLDPKEGKNANLLNANVVDEVNEDKIVKKGEKSRTKAVVNKVCEGQPGEAWKSTSLDSTTPKDDVIKAGEKSTSQTVVNRVSGGRPGEAGEISSSNSAAPAEQDIKAGEKLTGNSDLNKFSKGQVGEAAKCTSSKSTAPAEKVIKAREKSLPNADGNKVCKEGQVGEAAKSASSKSTAPAEKVIKAGEKSSTNANVNKVCREGEVDEAAKSTSSNSTALAEKVIKVNKKSMTNADVNKVSEEGQVGEAAKKTLLYSTAPAEKIGAVSKNTFKSTAPASLKKSDEVVGQVDTKAYLKTATNKVNEGNTETAKSTTEGAGTKVHS